MYDARTMTGNRVLKLYHFKDTGDPTDVTWSEERITYDAFILEIAHALGALQGLKSIAHNANRVRVKEELDEIVKATARTKPERIAASLHRTPFAIYDEDREDISQTLDMVAEMGHEAHRDTYKGMARAITETEGGILVVVHTDEDPDPKKDVNDLLPEEGIIHDMRVRKEVLAARLERLEDVLRDPAQDAVIAAVRKASYVAWDSPEEIQETIPRAVSFVQ